MLPVFSRFLDLPPGLRRHIYVDAGLVINSGRDLLLNPRENEHDDERPNLSPSLALMCICRIVHAETSLLFYSTNRFVIRYRRAGDLGNLRILQPKLLLALTYLTVQLNVANASRKRHAPTNCPSSDDKMLRADCSSAQILLSEWETTADYLSRHIKADALDFGLVCDVADVETAQRIVAPLYRLPTLAGCHIRLGPKPSHDVRLQQIARDAGLKAEGRRVTNEFSGFSRLPPELRLRILEYTDLVAPLSKVSWIFGPGHDFGYDLPRFEKGCPSSRCEPPYDVCHPNVHQGCLRSQCRLGPGHECPHYASGWGWGTEDGKFGCWTCSHYACQFRNCWRGKKRGTGQFSFCQRRHTSYTRFCHCWAPPTRLFLVSRAFRREARQVFFGKNHFDIDFSNYSLLTGWGPPRPARYPESMFLNDVISASALQYFRSLEFHFLHHDRLPPLGPSQTAAEFRFPSQDRLPRASYQSQADAEAELATHREWQRTVERITSNDGNGLGAALSSPSLLLHIRASWVAGLDTWEDYCSRHAMPLDKCDSAIDTLKALVASFWPPLLQAKGPPQVIFALFHSDWIRAGYFIRPGRPQDAFSIHEPPGFRYMQADLTIERTAEVGSGESKWAEGIWATFWCEP
jgi:hypothetical protein